MKNQNTRRKFIQSSGAMAMGLMGMPSLITARGETIRNTQKVNISSLFEANWEDALRIGERVIEKCVLDRVLRPSPPMKHHWVQPGGPYYLGQWIWDTMFVVDLLAILPDKKEIARIVNRRAS